MELEVRGLNVPGPITQWSQLPLDPQRKEIEEAIIDYFVVLQIIINYFLFFSKIKFIERWI